MLFKLKEFTYNPDKSSFSHCFYQNTTDQNKLSTAAGSAALVCSQTLGFVFKPQQ